MSQPVRIVVARENERWQVYCGHCDRTWAWDLMSEATRSARAHVGSLPEGKIWEVTVEKDGGESVPDWICGLDAFPPER